MAVCLQILSKLTVANDWPHQAQQLALALSYVAIITASWWTVSVLAVILLAAAIVSPRQTRSITPTTQPFQLAFLTEFRGLCMLLTCVAILAVDFRIFPRRFAKTAVFGFSVMDVGIAAIMAATGFAHRARPWRRTLQTVVACSVLGLARGLSVWSFNVNHHVGEYGSHWNFFFTIAGVQLLTGLWPHAQLQCAGSWAALLALTAWVQQPGNAEWFLSTDRASLLSANREGFVNVVAMWCVYSTAWWLSTWLLNPDGSPARHTGAVLAAFAWLFALLTSTSYVMLGEPSRRLVGSARARFCDRSTLILAWLGQRNLCDVELGACAGHSMFEPRHSTRRQHVLACA